MKIASQIKEITPNDIGKKAIFCLYNSGHEFINKHNNKKMSINISNNRSAEFHRLVFAVAQLLVYSAPESSMWNNKDPYLFIKAVELEHGFVEPVQRLDGKIEFYPVSISFTNMSQKRFKELFDCILKEAAKILDCSIEEILQNKGEFM